MKLKFNFMDKIDIEYKPKRYDWLLPKKYKYAHISMGSDKIQIKRVSTFDKTNLHNPHQFKNVVIKFSGNEKWWDADFFNLAFRFKRIK